MSAQAAAAAAQPKEAMKTPKYAWWCLLVTVLVSIAIVLEWMVVPGLTFPVIKEWLFAHNVDFQANPGNAALMGNLMGLTPIAALIMALPTSWLVRKFGPKSTVIAGMVVAILAGAICALTAESNFIAFLAGRCLLGAGIAMTAVSGPTCVSIWFPDTTRGRAMAIWSCWVPVGLIIINNIAKPIFNAIGMVGLLWTLTIIMVVICVLFAVVFRAPHADEASQVSAERKSFKEVWPFMKQHQLWCLIVAFLIFNYMNYAFSTYLNTWLQLDVASGGMGWDSGLAGLVAGLVTACGILAPIGGFILDKFPRNLKYVCVVIGMVGLTVCCCFAFDGNMFMFVLYVIFFCIGNMFLNACCRPLVPSFVFKGGATAVGLGLSFLTLGQYLGQTPTSYIFTAGLAAGMSYSQISLMFLVPVGIVGIIFTLFVKPSKNQGGKPAGKPEGKPEAAQK